MNQQTLKPGTLLRQGAYRIVKVLGQGGFGITYLAYDVALDKSVAIKEFFPKDFCDRSGETSHVTLGTSSSEQLVSRLRAKFLKEARNIARFDHPNIIKIFAAFEENGTAYYVMECIDGRSLLEVVKSGGALPEKTAVDYVTRIGEALDYVHSRQVNHLDVKPANIMLRTADKRPILIDFGLSKQYDVEGSQTSTTPTGVSHGYAPLEQYNNTGIDRFSPETDVYALAATLYFLLTGTVPPQATLLIDEQLMFPESVPAHLIDPITKAMSTSRKDRYRSVKEFLAAINGGGNGGSNNVPASEATEFPATSQSAPKQPQREIPKHPEKKDGKSNGKLILAIVAGVLIVGGIIAWVLTRGGSTESPAAVQDSIPAATDLRVSGMKCSTDIGECFYSGEIDADSLPHGNGKATWTEGIGLEYDGDWNHGAMNGRCIFTYRNGNIFEGTIQNNEFVEGKITNKENGDYFIGSFKDGLTDRGDWYDKNGKLYKKK